VNDPTPVVVRMPTELRDAIKAKAASEERSMAQAIRHALRLYVGLPAHPGEPT
jgi:predicted HicB family RNase H-like nuclease